MDQRLFLKNVCIFLLTIALLGGCKDSHKKDSSTPETLPPVKVQLIAVEKIQMANQIEILGTVQAAKRAVISSRISGNIVELLVAPGSRVQHGEKLVQINAEEISARLMQAKAQLDQASRNLQREQKLLAKKAATPETVKGLEDGEKIARAN